MKVGEHPVPDNRPKGCPCENPVAFMITHERPGLLSMAVDSFLETTRGQTPLVVFDDGSTSADKSEELTRVGRRGVRVDGLTHCGFIGTWSRILKMARNYERVHDSIIMLEDDIIFAKGWVDILQRMQRGIAELGFKQGMTSCFMPHDKPQSPVRSLQGVDAYQSMAHTWHCNMMPLEVLEDWHVFEEAAASARESAKKSVRGNGLDVYYVGGLAHRLRRVSFVSTSSWVKHVGVGSSLVEGQGFGSCLNQGTNLVEELR